jgi:iron complex outermembrane receptor protein
MSSNVLRNIITTTLALLVSSLIQPVLAQEALEEVVVTATKRSVSIQEVPVSIIAVDGKSLEQDAITDLAQLSRTIPNLIIGDAVLTTAVSIRGMGSQPERGFEQSVGMFIDDIYMPRSRQYRSPLMDVDRVEVLRGPQAVLFGLNSTAGAVSIITNRTRPGGELLFDIMGQYEAEHGGEKITAVLGGSPTDTLGLRLAVQSTRMDGYIHNDFNGKDVGGSDETVVRFSGVWEPTDRMGFDLKVESGEFDMDGNLGEQWGPDSLNQLLLLGLPGGDDGQLNWRHDIDAAFMPIVASAFGGRTSPGLSQKYENLSLTANFDIGEHTLTAILGSSEMDYDMYTDADLSALAIMDIGVIEEFEQDSFELRLTSPGGRRFDYILGFYMHDNEVSNHQPAVLDPTFSFAPGSYGFDQVYTNGSYTTASDLTSVFATGTFHFNDAWRLTAGVRSTDEDKNYARASQCLPVRGGVIEFAPSQDDQDIIDANSVDFFCANLDGFTDKRSANNVMPEVAIEIDFNDDIMWYAKYSESAKSGGWVASTIVALNLIAYDDEESDSIEVGMRSFLADGKIALNFAIFSTQFHDLQVNSFDPVTAAAGVRNAARATSEGIEFDTKWLINDSITMQLAYAYLDAAYDDFADAPCAISEVLAGTPAPCDATGKILPLAPEHSLNVGIDVNHALSSGRRFLAGLSVSYSGDYYTDAALEPALIQSSFTTVGARIGFEASDAKWNVSLVGTNLTDEAVLNNSFPFFNNMGFIQPPRRVWLQASWRFMRD